MITTVLSLILVPAATWFFINTLRKARETVISPDELITIHVQSLVKIYERGSRFQREWKAGAKIRERLGLEKNYTSWSDMNNLVWQLPLIGFLIYFTYFYLNNGFWIFVFSMCIWFSILGIWIPFKKLLTNFASLGNKKILTWVVQILDPVIFWLIPLGNIYLFQVRWHNIAIVFRTCNL
jgi:hypothetical protein